jgi:hypothetical protein
VSPPPGGEGERSEAQNLFQQAEYQFKMARDYRNEAVAKRSESDAELDPDKKVRLLEEAIECDRKADYTEQTGKRLETEAQQKLEIANQKDYSPSP